MTLRKKSLFYVGRAMIINAALLSVMIVLVSCKGTAPSNQHAVSHQEELKTKTEAAEELRLSCWEVMD